MLGARQVAAAYRNPCRRRKMAAALNSNGILQSLDHLADAPPTDERSLARDEPAGKLASRLEQRLHTPLPVVPALSRKESAVRYTNALAIFCYEEPESFIGQYVANLAAAVAARKTPVHVFTRIPFDLEAPGVVVHVTGVVFDGDIVDQAHEFARRAYNLFLEQFPDGADPAGLMGFEWTSLPALSLLREKRGLESFLSLHSLERQRTDMSADVSQCIEEIELAGLRDCTSILIHDGATGEVARYWVPECAGRLVMARPRFPTRHYEASLDPGVIKARYQVGPVDPTILFVGDLDERYGPDLVMKAMPAILKNHKQARFVVVGDGALYWPLRVYARYLLLEHAVRLAGNVEGQALNELIQAADIVVVPSRESTPWWPILAAWAARKPVVASHQAAPTFLEHEKDSVLFYPSENSCVWGIERILFDPELGQALAENGRRKLEERFGWNSVAEQIQQLMGAVAVK
jgi:glycosyltransferase involved in cell wall biosynthesis